MEKLTEQDITFVQEKADLYFMQQGLSCGLTMLHTLSDYYNHPMSPQVYAAMNGVIENRDRRDQCGLYKGALMFIAILGTYYGWDRPRINAVTIDFAEKLEAYLGSLKCYELRGGKFQDGEPHDKCAPLTIKAISFTLEYLKNIKF